MQKKIKKYIIVSSPDECPYQEDERDGYGKRFLNCWNKLDKDGNLAECSEENCPLKNVPDKRKQILMKLMFSNIFVILDIINVLMKY